MKRTTLQADPRQIADPFDEQAPLSHRRSFSLLGARVDFQSDAAELLALVDAAYARLPVVDSGMPHLKMQAQVQVQLRLAEGGADFVGEPPVPRMFGGAGLLGAALDAHNLAVVSPHTRSAVVQLSPALLRFPYHARYELIEFAVFTLASRAQGLMALHAGCVGAAGVGALLMGASGAGKSTLALHAMQAGLEFLTEDACFVDPDSARATGVPNFLHLRFDATQWVGDAPLRERITAAPVIRRRSGVEKHELDLRGGWAPLVSQPLQLRHLVFTSPEAAPDAAVLQPLTQAQWLPRLQASQPYAASQPGWARLIAACAGCHGWELKRGSHPRVGALCLQGLLTA